MESKEYIIPGEFQGSRKDYADLDVHMDSRPFWFEEFMGFKLEDLKGLQGVDIGGEPNGQFAKAAKEAGVNLLTYNSSMWSDRSEWYQKKGDIKESVHFDDKPVKSDVESIETGKENVSLVQGLAQSLPFAPNSMDFILSFGAVPHYLPPMESEYRAVFSEMVQVIKPDSGFVLIYPITQSLENDKIFKDIVEDLSREQGAKFEFTKRDIRKVDEDPEQLYSLKISKE